MRFSCIFAFIPSLLFLPSLGGTSPNTFADLLDSLGDLGYHANVSMTSGTLDNSTTADVPGANGSCAKTVRIYRFLDRIVSSDPA